MTAKRELLLNEYPQAKRSVREAGSIYWSGDGDFRWETSLDGTLWVLERITSVPRPGRGWYLRKDPCDCECGSHSVWAARLVADALKVAALLIRDEWERDLRDRDGMPTWRNRKTGAIRRQDGLLAGMKVRRR